MNSQIDHAVPDVRIHVLQVRKDDNAGVVDESVDASESVRGEFDDAAASRRLLEILVTGSCDAAVNNDLAHGAVSYRWIKSVAFRAHSRIVHNHRRTSSSQEPRIGRSQAASGTGHHDDLAAEIYRLATIGLRHFLASLQRVARWT
jgi:hypothetical protein